MKKLTHRTVFFCLASLFLSCTPMEENIPDYATCDFVIPNCDPLSFAPDTSGLVPITNSACQSDLGTKTLRGDSKRYMWFNCSSVNSLIYKDSLNNQIILNIDSRKHNFKNSYAYSFSEPGCPEFIYASTDEIMEITLTNQQINIKFKLELAPGGSPPDNYDGLAVNKTTFDDTRPFWSNEVLYMFLNNRNTDLTIVRYRHNVHLAIMGTIYDNVYWNDGRFDVPMEIYYNQDCGIIAFRDDQGVLWKIAGYN